MNPDRSRKASIEYLQKMLKGKDKKTQRRIKKVIQKLKKEIALYNQS